MVVIFKDFEKKAYTCGIILMLCVFAFYISYIINRNSLSMNITIDGYFKFSYPFAFRIDNIFVNSKSDNAAIETNLSFYRPLAQKFSTYDSIKGNFSFTYPSVFILSQKEFEGSDILYHLDFQDKSQISHGFVQVWNMPYSLKDFLDKSKSSSQIIYKYFNAKPVTINGLSGYYWDYVFLGGDNKYYKGSEVFLKKNDRMYRISFFVPENQWNQSQADIFTKMVNSFKIY